MITNSEKSLMFFKTIDGVNYTLKSTTEFENVELFFIFHNHFKKKKLNFQDTQTILKQPNNF